MEQKFFLIPFATSGDQAAIPNDTQPSGEVSYSQGYGFDYQRPLDGSDPLAKPIERASFNGLMNAVTGALGQYQRASHPEFITTADNAGAAFAYSKGVIVRYRASPSDPFITYVSRADANVALPSVAASWQKFLFEEATQAQAEAGADDSTVMTPRRVLQCLAANGASPANATTTTVGVTRYATTVETNGIAITNAAVTPSGLVGFLKKTGGDMTGGVTYRGTASQVWLYDNNNDVPCLALAAGYSSTTDRTGTITNPNAGGSIIIAGGNLSNKLHIAPASASLDSAFNVGGVLSSSTRVDGPAFRAGVGATEGTYQFSIDQYYIYNNAGAVGIFDAGGTGVAMSFTKSSNTWSFRGQLVPTGGFQNGSSRELKTEGRENDVGLRAVLAFETRIAAYHPWASTDGNERMFLIAENVEEHAPLAVRDDLLELSPDGTDESKRFYKTLDYGQIGVVLVKALQEENAERKAECEQLRAEISELRDLVRALTKGA